MFAGATHEEGATTLALNYARLLTMQSNEQVLLVEMNARRPSLFWKLGLSGKDGVTHYLDETRSISSVAQPSGVERLDVIHVGDKDPARIQMHMDDTVPRLLDDAFKSYDTIIVDAPAVVLSPETPPMTPAVDGVVVVLKCDQTKREIVQRSLSMINQFSGRVLGVVLNRKKYYIPEFIYKRI